MLVEVMDVVVTLLALPMMIAALVLLVRAIAQPDEQAANRLYGWVGGLMITFVLLATATNLLRRFLEN